MLKIVLNSLNIEIATVGPKEEENTRGNLFYCYCMKKPCVPACWNLLAIEQFD